MYRKLEDDEVVADTEAQVADEAPEQRRFLGDWDQHWPSWAKCDSDEWCNSQKQGWINDYPGDYRCQYKDPYYSHCCGGGGAQCSPMYRKLEDDETNQEPLA
ncbi:unnamed protein product [Chrysoparadoxa australica]